jgi:hypothetical protein
VEERQNSETSFEVEGMKALMMIEEDLLKTKPKRWFIPKENSTETYRKLSETTSRNSQTSMKLLMMVASLQNCTSTSTSVTERETKMTI